MTNSEVIMVIGRITQEYCNVLPRDAVEFFAEGLRRRHRSVPDTAQRYLDALANVVMQMDPPPPKPPVFRVIKGGAHTK